MTFNISVLIFIKNSQDEFLLIERTKSPNKGLWSPIGGKIETAIGESPFEGAIREIKEEVNFNVSDNDLHLFSMITEKSYEGMGHWLLFLFDCKKPLEVLPTPIDEGKFQFFKRDAINRLDIPASDESILWDMYDRHRNGFISMRANFMKDNGLDIFTEQIL